MRARHVSIWWSKIGSVIFVAAMLALKAVLKWDIDYKEILFGGAFIFVVGLPIDASVWMDKLSEIVKAKIGGSASGPTA